MFGQESDIRGGIPRYDSDHGDTYRPCEHYPITPELVRIRRSLRHLNGLLQTDGQDGTLRDPMSLGALRTTVLCLANVVDDLIGHLLLEK